METDYTTTLNELIQKAAAEWTEDDLLKIVFGFRDQRDRWTAEQAAGSRKIVRSSAIQVETKPVTVKQVLRGLKL